MLYLIGGIILLLIFARFGSGGIGCLFFLVILYLLWRFGVLSFIIRFTIKVIRWVFTKAVYYYHNFFGTDEGIAYVSTKISGFLFASFSVIG